MRPTDPLDILQISQAAALNAYAPYSSFKVGAAVLFAESPQIYIGVNVENTSYGLTICAERAAIFAGIAAGHRRIKRVALSCYDLHGNQVACYPCGACLQVMHEFALPITQIIIANTQPRLLTEFLPYPFN